MLDKTPQRHPAAFPLTVLLRLPARRSVAACRLRLGSVSGFPLACLTIRMPCADPSHRQELVGLPKFLHASLPACHGLSTPADLPTLALLQSGVLVLPSVNVQTLGVRNSHISKLYQHFRARGHPCGLQDSLSTLRPGCSQCLFVTLLSPLRTGLDARLDTGGWLGLTRQGLSPCKKRQAFLARGRSCFIVTHNGGSRERRICRARREFFLRSVGEAGLSMADLGRLCGMNPASVSRAVETARAELRSAKPTGELANKT